MRISRLGHWRRRWQVGNVTVAHRCPPTRRVPRATRWSMRSLRDRSVSRCGRHPSPRVPALPHWTPAPAFRGPQPHGAARLPAVAPRCSHCSAADSRNRVAAGGTVSAPRNVGPQRLETHQDAVHRVPHGVINRCVSSLDVGLGVHSASGTCAHSAHGVHASVGSVTEVQIVRRGGVLASAGGARRWPMKRHGLHVLRDHRASFRRRRAA